MALKLDLRHSLFFFFNITGNFGSMVGMVAKIRANTFNLSAFILNLLLSSFYFYYIGRYFVSIKFTVAKIRTNTFICRLKN